MTDDLVKLLREFANEIYGKHPCGLVTEAADRIEQLEAALRTAAHQLYEQGCPIYMSEEAFAALAGEKKDG